MANRDAPTYYVQIVPPGKSAQPVDVSERTISVDYDDDDAKLDQLELTLDNFDLAMLDDPNWVKGNSILVQWGYAGNLTPARECIIQKITGNRVLKVIALAKSILMHKVDRFRTFDNMKRSDIVAQIATENGYGSSVQFIDDTKVTIRHTSQARMTDAEFVAHLAKREGFVFYVGPDGFHFERRKMNKAPTKQLVYYLDGTGTLVDFNLENDVTVHPGVVRAKGRDPLNKKDIDEVGSNQTTTDGFFGLAPNLETAAPKAPDETSTDASNADSVVEDVDVRTATTQERAIAKDETIMTTSGDPQVAKREADGKFIHAQQATILLSLECVGDPLIAAKQVIDVQGISKRLSGRYYIKNAKHKVTASGYTMTLSVRSDGNHGGAAGTSKDSKSTATQNTAPEKDPNALSPVEVVDSRTGETTVEYRPGGG